MSKIGIEVEANISKAKKDLQSLDKEVKNLLKTASKGANKGGFSMSGLGVDKLEDLGKFTDIKGLVRGGLGRLGGMSLGGLGGGAMLAGGVAAAGVAAAGAWYSHIKGLVDEGKQAQATYDRLNATLGQIGKNVAGISDVSTTVQFLQEMAAKGKTPLEALEQTANRLMVAFRGNQTEVKKWTTIIADMAAGSGESATMLTEVITKAKQFDTVEFSVFTQLNEKGIPIIKSLAEHLGITTEKAEELARAGKVTGDNFMAAYEIAHRMTFAGANALGGTATIEGALNAITKYLELQAAAATLGYNSQMLPYLQERAAYEENKYRDPYERLNSLASGMLLGGLEVGWQKFTDGLADFGDWCGKLLGSNIADTLGSTESINASIGTYSFLTFGVKGAMYKSASSMEILERQLAEAQAWYDDFLDEDSKARLELALQAYNDNWHTSAEIDGWLNTMRALLEQERAKANSSKFDDDTRNNARQAVQDLEAAIKICEDAMRAVKAHEAELAEIEKLKKAEAEGQRVLLQHQINSASTSLEHARALGFSNYDALKAEHSSIIGRIYDGKGTQADLDRLKELLKVVDIANKEAETARKDEQGRREYDLSLTEAGRVLLLLEQEATKLKALGFTSDEVQTRLDATRDRLLTEAQEKQLRLDATLADKAEDSYYNYRGSTVSDAYGNHRWERNAWGAAGASYTVFLSPLDLLQLDLLEKANSNLKALISATQKIDTRALAL